MTQSRQKTVTAVPRSNLGFARPCLRRPLKQSARLNVQNHCELIYHVDRCAIDAAFQRTDVGAIDVSLMGQRLLRQALRGSSLPQIPGEDLSYVHTREASDLSCISPRSILYNRQAEVFMFKQRSELKRDHTTNTNIDSEYSPTA